MRFSRFGAVRHGTFYARPACMANDKLRLPIHRMPRATRVSHEYHTSAAPELPIACVEATQLRALARKLDQLAGWHELMGGPARGQPCLVRVGADQARGIVAVVRVDDQVIEVRLTDGEWELASVRT